ncbi:MAG: SAM-dependent methyltransferase [Firmicutes bacterium]|nr:SAM-dependent methyltransferase [Bacillota bacterium]
MKISNRLKLVASFVDDNSHVIDVGCDHALLSIFLAKTKNNIKVIASDVNEGPLEGARKNIKLYNLEDKIEIKLGDGIETINKDTDTIIISGLGGETIIDILKDDLTRLENIKTIILSPHSAIYETRKELTKLGYKIVDEIFIYDQNKPYNIIKFIKGKETYSDDELYFGPIILKNKNEYFYKYYRNLNNKNKKILETIPKENESIRNRIIKEIERLDRNI